LDQSDENVEKRLFDFYNQQMELRREFVLPFRGDLIGDTVNTTNDIYVPDLQNNEEQDRIIAIEASSIDPKVPWSSNSSIVILPSRNVTVVGENKNVSRQTNKENLNSSSLERNVDGISGKPNNPKSNSKQSYQNSIGSKILKK
jgi:hypothetical protein